MTREEELELLGLVRGHDLVLFGDKKKNFIGLVDKQASDDIEKEMRMQEQVAFRDFQEQILNKVDHVINKQNEIIHKQDDLEKQIQEYKEVAEWKAAVQNYMSRFITWSWWKKIFKGGFFVAIFCILVYTLIKEGFEAAIEKLKELFHYLK